MEKRKHMSKGWKLAFQGLPLSAVIVATFLPLRFLGQQFLMLIVLLWIQVFFIVAYFLVGR